MVFNSFAFAAFFLTVYVLYLLTMRRHRLQNALLLIASYVFYGWWDWRFLALLAFTTLVDFAIAILLDRRRGVSLGTPSHDASPRYALTPAGRRRLLFVSIVANLGVLGFFKYFGFFVDSAVEGLALLRWEASGPAIRVLLPIGISFYTFQSLSYTIDVYRGELRASRNLIDFALFVSFFPQLVAGPIARANDLLPQVSRPRILEIERILEGAYLIFWGLFKKIVIADNVAALVDAVFSTASPAGDRVVLGVWAYAIQIYCDFSGYSDIARGCAKTMGFEFPLNFRLPYFASNPAEFWRRWHISLSTWLRDYLYIPLGGNRLGSRRTYANLMVTMLLGGLWHGAAWTFVVWGLLHGVLLAGHRWITARRRTAGPGEDEGGTPVERAFKTIGFFQLVCLGWLVFRAESMGQVVNMLAAVFAPETWRILSGQAAAMLVEAARLAAFSLPLFLLEWLQFRRQDLNALLALPAPVRGFAYAGLLFALVLTGNPTARPFIYFQF